MRQKENAHSEIRLAPNTHGGFIGEDLEALAGMHQALSHGGIDSIPLCWSEQFLYHHEQEIDVVIGRENIPAALAVVPVDLPYAQMEEPS